MEGGSGEVGVEHKIMSKVLEKSKKVKNRGKHNPKRKTYY